MPFVSVFGSDRSRRTEVSWRYRRLRCASTCPRARTGRPGLRGRASRGRSSRARVEPAVQRRGPVRGRGRAARRWPGGRASHVGSAPRSRRSCQGRH